MVFLLYWILYTVHSVDIKHVTTCLNSLECEVATLIKIYKNYLNF